MSFRIADKQKHLRETATSKDYIPWLSEDVHEKMF
jgi:hypothetical protein